jgi:hypothetical protein
VVLAEVGIDQEIGFSNVGNQYDVVTFAEESCPNGFLGGEWLDLVAECEFEALHKSNDSRLRGGIRSSRLILSRE